MQKEYGQIVAEAQGGGALAGNKIREPHLQDLSQRLGQVQDMASNLQGDLRELGDRLLGEEPQTSEKLGPTPVPGIPCSGTVGELFERTDHLHTQIKHSLQYLARLKKLA